SFAGTSWRRVDMHFRFTQPLFLLLLAPAFAWIIWLSLRSYAQLTPFRRWLAFGLRALVLLLLIFSLAGLQWLRQVEGMNTFFVLDRSESVPPTQQDTSRDFVNQMADKKKHEDKAGVIVFGTEASIESLPNSAIKLEKIQAVVDPQRTDLAAAIRL